MIEPKLLEIMCCPETHQPIKPVDDTTIEAINKKIEAGELKNRGGAEVTEKIDGGLIREDGKYLYPIRKKIPIMLIDEAIPQSS